MFSVPTLYLDSYPATNPFPYSIGIVIIVNSTFREIAGTPEQNKTALYYIPI